MSLYHASMSWGGFCFAGYCVDRALTSGKAPRLLKFWYWDYKKQMDGKTTVRGLEFDLATKFAPAKSLVEGFESAVIGESGENYAAGIEADFQAWALAAKNQHQRVLYRKYKNSEAYSGWERNK